MHPFMCSSTSACSVLSLFKPKKCGGEEEYQFLKQFATNSKLKVILSCSHDACLYIIRSYSLSHMYTYAQAHVHVHTYVYYWRSLYCMTLRRMPGST